MTRSLHTLVLSSVVALTCAIGISNIVSGAAPGGAAVAPGGAPGAGAGGRGGPGGAGAFGGGRGGAPAQPGEAAPIPPEVKQANPPRTNAAATFTRSGVRSDQRHNAFVETAKKGDVDILFHGDSITDWWQQAG